MSQALVHHPPPMTVAEFLRWEGNPDRRYELIEGEIIEMNPPTAGHALLLINLGYLLRLALANRPEYRILGNGGVSDAGWERTVYAADLVVTRAPVRRGQAFVKAPVLVAEILSDSTEPKDRERKVPDYQSIASVEEVLLVDQNRSLVDLFTRAGTGGGPGDGWRVHRIEGLDATVPLRSVGVTIALAELYQGLDLET